jgi:hypothetical protein
MRSRFAHEDKDLDYLAEDFALVRTYLTMTGGYFKWN